MDEAWYIDHEDRVYRDWQAYLDNNRLPKMTICYPKNGYYSTKEDGYSQFHPEKPGKVLVAFGNTPETKYGLHVRSSICTGSAYVSNIHRFGLYISSFHTHSFFQTVSTNRAHRGSCLYWRRDRILRHRRRGLTKCADFCPDSARCDRRIGSGGCIRGWTIDRQARRSQTA
jgi:hypothetical protein